MALLKCEFMRCNMKKTIKWVMFLGWMCVIFLFSQQSGQESSQTSGMLETILGYLPFIPRSILGIELETIIRKGAHFTEYFILYLLGFNVLCDSIKDRKKFLLPLGVVFLYACTDEIHQAFVPGRACLFTDVLIDTAGGALAMFVMFMIYILKNKHLKSH